MIQWYNISFIELCKNFRFNSRWTQSTRREMVGQSTCAVIFIEWGYKCPLLGEIWIYNFSRRILERVVHENIVNIRNECLFLGSWGMSQSAEQTNRPRTARRVMQFVCPVLQFIPHEPRKLDTHSLSNTDLPEKLLFHFRIMHIIKVVLLWILLLMINLTFLISTKNCYVKSHYMWM